MKKIKEFIQKKGGLKLFLVSLALVLLAGILILVGVIYTSFGGDWSKLGTILTSEFAIAIYVVIGLVLFALLYITIISGRNREIK